MALVTISGFPCSGKSKRANELKDFFQSKLNEEGYNGLKFDVVVISDESVHVGRDVYDDSLAEKPARANLFSAVIRTLGPNVITICDSANYIKGFRYQMYCAAREAHCRVCTIHVVAPIDKCREWHEERGECSYKPTTFDNLIMRYEEPSSMVRWDSPLFTLPWDETPPFEDIWDTITKGHKKPPTTAVQHHGPPPPNTLQTLTLTTSTIVTSLLSHLTAAPGSPTFPIPSPPATSKLLLRLPSRTLTLPELQRLKRQFEMTQTRAQKSNGKAVGVWTESAVASAFVGFLEAAWGTA